MCKEESKHEESFKMATQMQPTPTLYGKDAEDVLNQIKRKPTKEQRAKLIADYRNKFAGVKKKGLR
ncbi:MAG TPA: hypothetical protein DDY49_03460 [Paenibacillaceae bacterium]|nr:hypothetical protein [Paenibacillaceae bacterium]